MTSDCREYKEWMEQLGGVVVGKGKQRHYKLINCLDTYCKGCTEDDSCDICGARLCYYLAKCIDDEVLCPDCWVSVGCPVDDRLKDDGDI